jgi:hypothetical protein
MGKPSPYETGIRTRLAEIERIRASLLDEEATLRGLLAAVAAEKKPRAKKTEGATLLDGTQP